MAGSLWEALAASKVSGQAGGEQALAGAANALSGASQTAQNLFESRKDMYEGLQKTVTDAITGIQEWLGEDPTWNAQTQMWEKGSGLGQLVDPHYERNARRTEAMNAAGNAALARRDEALFGLTGGARDTSSYATQQTGVINNDYGNILDRYGLTIDQAAALSSNPNEAIVFAELRKKNDSRFTDTQSFVNDITNPKLQEHLGRYTAIKRQLEDREAGVKGEYYYEAMADATADTDALSGISRDNRIQALKSIDEAIMGKKQGESIAEFNVRRGQNELAAAFGTSGAAATVQALNKAEDNIKQVTKENTELKDRVKQLEDSIQKMKDNISNNKEQMYSQFSNTSGVQQQGQPDVNQQQYQSGGNAQQLDEYANVGDRKIGIEESLDVPKNGNIESLQNNRNELYLLYAGATGFDSDNPDEIEKYVQDQMSLYESGKLEDDDKVFNIITQDGRTLNGVTKKQLLKEVVQSERALSNSIFEENLRRSGFKNGRSAIDYQGDYSDNDSSSQNAYNQLISDKRVDNAGKAANDIINQEKANNSQTVKEARDETLKKAGYNAETGETNFGQVVQNEDGSYTVVPKQAQPAYQYPDNIFTPMSNVPSDTNAVTSHIVDISNAIIGGDTNKSIFTLTGPKSALTDENGNVNGFFDGLGNLAINVASGQTVTNDIFYANNKYSPLATAKLRLEADVSVGGRVLNSPLGWLIGAAGAKGSAPFFGKFGEYISPFLTKTLGAKGATIANSYNKAITQIVNLPGFSVLAPAAADGSIVAGIKTIGRHTAGTTMFLLRGVWHSPRELAKGVGKLKESLLGNIPEGVDAAAKAAAVATRNFRKKLIYGALGAIGGSAALKFAVDHFEKTGEVTEELADHIANGLVALNPDQRRKLFTKLYSNEKQDEGNLTRARQTVGHFLINSTGLYNDDAAAMYSQVIEKDGALDTILKLTDRGTRALAPTIMHEAYKACFEGDAEAIKKFKGLGVGIDALKQFYMFTSSADLDFLVKQIDNSAPNADITRDVLKISMPFLSDAQAQVDQIEINKKALKLQKDLNDGPAVRSATANAATVELNNIGQSSAMQKKYTGENIKNVNANIQQTKSTALKNQQEEYMQTIRDKGMSDSTYKNCANLFMDATGKININSATKPKDGDTDEAVDTVGMKSTKPPTGLIPKNKDQIPMVAALDVLIGEDYHNAANQILENLNAKHINKFTSLKNKYFDINTKQFKKGASKENFMREFAGILNNAFFAETDLSKALKLPDNTFFKEGAAVTYITKHTKELFPVISQLMFLPDGQLGLEEFEKIMLNPNVKLFNKANKEVPTDSLVRKQNRKRPD